MILPVNGVLRPLCLSRKCVDEPPPGPTFQELFKHLLPDTNGLPDVFPSQMIYVDRSLVIKDFRLRAAMEWRRRGLIDWDKNIGRSLRPGPQFRAGMRRNGLTGFALTSNPR